VSFNQAPLCLAANKNNKKAEINYFFFIFQARNHLNASSMVVTDVLPTQAIARSTVMSTLQTNRTTAKSEAATSHTHTHQVSENT
jgi:hypothetical protein